MTDSRCCLVPGLMTMSSAVASMLEAKLYCFNYISNDLASLAKDHGVVLVVRQTMSGRAPSLS